MKDAAQKRWEKAQKDAVKSFKPIVVSYTIDECPDCYGGLPQGNESAWVKGCNVCNVRSACSEATEKVYEAAMTNKEWTAYAERMRGIMAPAYWLKKFGNGRPK
jgi:hypothetical protein